MDKATQEATECFLLVLLMSASAGAAVGSVMAGLVVAAMVATSIAVFFTTCWIFWLHTL